MTEEEIECRVQARGRDDWPIGEIACFGAALLYYASLGHDFRTGWELTGFLSLMAAGIVNGVTWCVRGEHKDNELRDELRKMNEVKK